MNNTLHAFRPSPAKAGVQLRCGPQASLSALESQRDWTPAFAGEGLRNGAGAQAA
jgi:hypothetical protein